MCLAAASYALAASSAVSNVPSHNRAPRFGSRISAAQLFVVCLLMSASLFNKKKEYFCGEFGKRNFAPSKKRKISPKKREKKEVLFSYLPHGLCRTPRYTEEHCFLVFVLVDPPCWAVVPPPPSKEEGSSLAFCFKTKTKTKKKWGSLEEEINKKKCG